MKSVPTKSELQRIVQRRYAADIERAKATRDSLIQTINNLDPAVVELFAIYLSDDGPEVTGRIVERNETPAQIEKQADIDEMLDSGSEAKGFGGVSILRRNDAAIGYGDIAERIRAAVIRMEGEFTYHDVLEKIDGIKPKPTTIAGVLKRMERQGMLICIQPGAGKRPGKFKRATQREVIGNLLSPEGD